MKVLEQDKIQMLDICVTSPGIQASKFKQWVTSWSVEWAIK